MSDAQKVTVYVRAGDARFLREVEDDPARWVRAIVKQAIQVRRERARRESTRESE